MGMSRIFWDTNVFIYLFESRGNEFELVTNLRKAMLSRRDQLLTSTLTLGELLVKPLARNDGVHPAEAVDFGGRDVLTGVEHAASPARADHPLGE